jgi:hypothetical protein
MNVSGSFLLLQLVFNHSAIFWILGLSITLASEGQFFTHAQQRIHFSASVTTVSATVMAPVGQTEAQVSHWVQSSSWVIGEIAPLELLSLCGKFPGTSIGTFLFL